MIDGLVRLLVRLESALAGLEQQLAQVTAERDELGAQQSESTKET